MPTFEGRGNFAFSYSLPGSPGIGRGKLLRHHPFSFSQNILFFGLLSLTSSGMCRHLLFPRNFPPFRWPLYLFPFPAVTRVPFLRTLVALFFPLLCCSLNPPFSRNSPNIVFPRVWPFPLLSLASVPADHVSSRSDLRLSLFLCMSGPLF